MASDTGSQQSESGQLRLVGKLLSYPLVSTAVDKSRALYERGRASNAYMTRTFEMMEKSVNVAVTAASPYVSKYDTQIRKLDAAACEKLEAIEKQVPEWKNMNANEAARELSKRVIEESRNGAKQVYDSTVKPRVVSARHSVDVHYAKLLGKIDSYVDYYLPETDKTDKNGSEYDKTSTELERSVRGLTNKVTTRVGRLATRRLAAVRSRSLESLERARGTGEFVMGTVRTTYDELARAVRVELDEEKRKTKCGTHDEPAQDGTPTYGELQRRLRDSVLLGRAFTKVGTRYTTTFLNEPTVRAYYADWVSYASGVTNLLPLSIRQIRIAVRLEEAPSASPTNSPLEAPSRSTSDSDSNASAAPQDTTAQPNEEQSTEETSTPDDNSEAAEPDQEEPQEEPDEEESDQE